jgi:hypothetical protein
MLASAISSRGLFARLCVLAALLLPIAGGCRSGSAPTANPGADARTSTPPSAAPITATPTPKKGRDDGSAYAGTEARATATPEERAAARRFETPRCRKKDCCVTELWPVGRDRKSRQLAVVVLETNKACLLPQEPAKASSAEAGDDSDDRHACGEYWLIDVGAQKRPAIAQLARQCAGDKWEIGADVNAKDMTFSYGGKSVYASTQTSEWTTIGLDPVRLVQVNRTSSGRQDRSETWDSDDFSGELELGVFYCPGKSPTAADASSADSNVPDVEIAALRIPHPSLPETFVADGWKTTGLGRCAARVGGDRGFIVHGAKGTAADASMRIVFSSQGNVFVEVTDDRFVTGAKTWVKDDHIEIWAAAPPESGCIDPSAKSPAVQWGIRVTDGQVFAGAGPPATTPRVEVARVNDKTIRLRIAFEANSLPGPRFTIVYSDSDDGTHQKRLIGTSQVVFGKWWTLGEAPEDEGASCTIVRGALEPRNPGLPGL